MGVIIVRQACMSVWLSDLSLYWNQEGFCRDEKEGIVAGGISGAGSSMSGSRNIYCYDRNGVPKSVPE